MKKEELIFLLLLSIMMMAFYRGILKSTTTEMQRECAKNGIIKVTQCS